MGAGRDWERQAWGMPPSILALEMGDLVLRFGDGDRKTLKGLAGGKCDFTRDHSRFVNLLIL